MEKSDARDDHERFRQLCALAQLNSLGAREQLDLERHLLACASCRQVHQDYCAIGSEGMAFLSAADVMPEEARRWDNRAARERLFASIRRPMPQRVLSIETGRPRHPWSLPSMSRGREMAVAALAACVLVALTLGAYRIGERKLVVTSPTLTDLRSPQSIPPAQAPDNSLATQSAQLSKLEKQISTQEIEIAKLRAASIFADERVDALGTANGEKESALQQLTEERDQLAKRLADNEKAYEGLQADYATLRDQHRRSLLHTASVEAELTDLRASNGDQERRLKDDEQFLTSDRDIRELMGARKLYSRCFRCG